MFGKVPVRPSLNLITFPASITNLLLLTVSIITNYNDAEVFNLASNIVLSVLSTEAGILGDPDVIDSPIPFKWQLYFLMF